MGTEGAFLHWGIIACTTSRWLGWHSVLVRRVFMQRSSLAQHAWPQPAFGQGWLCRRASLHRRPRMRSRQFVGYIGLQLRSQQLAGEAHQEYSSTPPGVAQPGGQSVPLFPSGCLLVRCCGSWWSHRFGQGRLCHRPGWPQAGLVTGRLGHRPALSQAGLVTGRLGFKPAWFQAGLVTSRLGHRLAWSPLAWLDAERAFPYRASSLVPQAACWHRLLARVLACTVPSPFAQLAFADECWQWCLLLPVVVQTQETPKLCT